MSLAHMALVEETDGRDALRLARRDIRQGRFQRTLAIMTAFAAIVSGFEAYIQHTRGAFKHWLMWTPVWLTPLAIVSTVAALFSEAAARWLLGVTSIVSLVDGLIGFGYHVRGIQRMPGGFRLGQYNIVMGPPIFAPLLTCMVGVLGLLTALLRREQLHEPRVLGVPRGGALTLAEMASGRRNRGLAAAVAHGRFQRVLAMVSALFAVLAGGEAYFEHLRGSFNDRFMWTPVWVTPFMAAAGVGAAKSERVARGVLPLVAVVTFVDGLLGFFLHLRGIKRMPGGFANLQFNVTLGPPLFAPLLFSSVGLLGFLAALLRRRERL